MTNKYLYDQKFRVTKSNNFFCIMKSILIARDAAVNLMQRIIINGNSTSLWFDPWLNYKSTVDILGWQQN